MKTIKSLFVKSLDLILALTCLVAVAASFYFLPKVNGPVPIHWNLWGEVDQSGNKVFGLFLLPLISLTSLILFWLMPKIDPLKGNLKQFPTAFQILKASVVLLFLYLHLVVLVATFVTPQLPSPLVFSVPFSVFLIILGAILPHFKRNYFAGIRTPWTLASDEVWAKTHDLGGKMFLVAGTVGLVAATINPAAGFVSVITCTILAELVSVGYSLYLFNHLSS